MRTLDYPSAHAILINDNKVFENGIGMDKEKLNGVLSEEHKKSIGIFNIEKRLTQLYGKGLEIISEPE